MQKNWKVKILPSFQMWEEVDCKNFSVICSIYLCLHLPALVFCYISALHRTQQWIYQGQASFWNQSFKMLWTERLCLPKFIHWNLNPVVWTLTEGVFETWLGYESGRNGISTLMRRDQRVCSFSLSAYHHVRIQKEDSNLQTRKQTLCRHWIY